DILRHGCVSAGGRAAEQARFERFEFSCLRRCFPFLAHLCQRLLDNGERPPSFEECLRSFFFYWFKPIPSFGSFKLNRKWNQSPTPLQCPPAREVIRKIVLQRRQKKSAKTAAFFSKRIEVATFDQRSEEALGKISRIVRRRATAPDIRIQGI